MFLFWSLKKYNFIAHLYNDYVIVQSSLSFPNGKRPMKRPGKLFGWVFRLVSNHLGPIHIVSMHLGSILKASVLNLLSKSLCSNFQQGKKGTYNHLITLIETSKILKSPDVHFLFSDSCHKVSWLVRIVFVILYKFLFIKRFWKSMSAAQLHFLKKAIVKWTNFLTRVSPVPYRVGTKKSQRGPGHFLKA